LWPLSRLLQVIYFTNTIQQDHRRRRHQEIKGEFIATGFQAAA
jgi:hypothetical protein